MTKLSAAAAKNRHILQKAIKDIDIIIDDLHKLSMYFDRGSIQQRLITDLDGARITTRALLCLEENPDDY